MSDIVDLAAMRAAVNLLAAMREQRGKAKPILFLSPASDSLYHGLPEEEREAIHTILNGAAALLDRVERADAQRTCETCAYWHGGRCNDHFGECVRRPPLRDHWRPREEASGGG